MHLDSAKLILINFLGEMISGMFSQWRCVIRGERQLQHLGDRDRDDWKFAREILSSRVQYLESPPVGLSTASLTGMDAYAFINNGTAPASPGTQATYEDIDEDQGRKTYASFNFLQNAFNGVLRKISFFSHQNFFTVFNFYV